MPAILPRRFEFCRFFYFLLSISLHLHPTWPHLTNPQICLLAKISNLTCSQWRQPPTRRQRQRCRQRDHLQPCHRHPVEGERPRHQPLTREHSCPQERRGLSCDKEGETRLAIWPILLQNFGITLDSKVSSFLSVLDPYCWYPWQWTVKSSVFLWKILDLFHKLQVFLVFASARYWGRSTGSVGLPSQETDSPGILFSFQREV